MKRKPEYPITKIRTGTGDSGKCVIGCTGHSKAGSAAEYLAYLDVAQTSLGLCYAPETGYSDTIAEVLSTLFNLGAIFHQSYNVATPSRQFSMTPRLTANVNQMLMFLDAVELKVPGFMTTMGMHPSGTMIARANVRMAELAFWRWRQDLKRPDQRFVGSDLTELNNLMGKALNIASDVLFAIAVMDAAEKSIFWDGEWFVNAEGVDWIEV